MAKRTSKQSESFSTTFRVAGTPQAVFDAINDVRTWWVGQIAGPTDVLGEAFTYRYKDFHRSTQKVVELVPGKKVAWEVTASKLGFENPTEWTGTRIEFELAPAGRGTEVRFTHRGLVPSCDCYQACSEGWTFLMTESLKKRIATGKGAEAWS